MNYLIDGLLFAHFMGLAMGFAGGLGMSLTGPRLIAASGEAREQLWPLATGLSRMAGAGLAILLISGPLMLWLKFGGASGLSPWFMGKMAFVVLGLVAFALSEVAKARFKRGDEGAGRMMMVVGPLTGISMTGVVLCAVLTFN